MNGKPLKNCCLASKSINAQGDARPVNCPDSAKPLSKICKCERFKVCKVRGDRKHCARMAQLGVLPGSEIELICPIQSQNCMVKVKGGTVSLDQLTAENIFVTPA